MGKRRELWKEKERVTAKWWQDHGYEDSVREVHGTSSRLGDHRDVTVDLKNEGIELLVDTKSTHGLENITIKKSDCLKLDKPWKSIQFMYYRDNKNQFTIIPTEEYERLLRRQ